MTTLKRGNCYVTCEALFHLMGGREAGWKPMNMRFEGDQHWFLYNEYSGQIVDPTASQFKRRPTLYDYVWARGRGFRTRDPSRRARQLMHKLLWQENAA